MALHAPQYATGELPLSRIALIVSPPKTSANLLVIISYFSSGVAMTGDESQKFKKFESEQLEDDRTCLPSLLDTNNDGDFSTRRGRLPTSKLDGPIRPDNSYPSSV